MKITPQILPGSQIRFDVEVPGEYSRNAYDRILKDMMRKVRVPGFRPGKAPKQLLLNYVGMDSIKSSIVESLFQDILKQVMDYTEESGHQLIGEPTIEPNIDELTASMEIGAPQSITFTMDFEPEVTLGDYKNLSVVAGKVEPDPDYVSNTLYAYRVKHSTLVPVEDRTVQEKDVVTLQMEVIDLEDGTIVEELTEEESKIDLTEGILQFQIFKMLLGMGINETKEAELTIEDDFPFPSLQNRRIRVKQTVIDIKYRDLPPLDDEFARLISSKQTLAELEEFLRQQAIERADELTQENIETALSNALVQITTVDLPETIISFHTNQVIREIMATMADSLGVEPNLLVEQLTAEMIGEMKEAAREQAIVKAKAELGLQQLAKLENLVIPPDLYQQTMGQIVEATGGKIPRDSNLERSVNNVLYRRLAMDWLKANAKIELIPEQDVEQEEAEEKPESPDLVHNTDS